MLSRTSVPLIAIVCVLLVGGIALTVQTSFHQDQVAADAEIQNDALALAAVMADLPGQDVSDHVFHNLSKYRDTLLAQSNKPFTDRIPLSFHEYEWRWDAQRRLIVGRPKFYGRGFWLTVAVIADADNRLHFYVNDAGGRWGIEPPGFAFNPDWHEYIH